MTKKAQLAVVKTEGKAAAKPAGKAPAPKAKTNTFAELGDILGNGMGDLMKEGDEFAHVQMADILVGPQVRKRFEAEGDSTTAEMDASVKKHGVITPILLRPIDGPVPFKLVAGERRYISNGNNNNPTIPALIRQMTDEEERELQFVENIHRLNLSQIEEAQHVQDEIDSLGSVEAVLAKYNKGRPWLSKLLSLLKLPAETSRLVTEGISADVEVIGMVKQIEKIDPPKAKEVVDELKAKRGKEDARAIAGKAKEEVKPSNKPAKTGAKATPKDTTAELPGVVTKTTLDPAWPFPTGATDDAADKRGPALPPSQALDKAYTMIFESGSSPKMVLDTMAKEERAAVESWLNDFYDAGKQSKNTSRAVVEGLRKGTFATDGYGAFALVAFLNGSDSDVKAFNALNVLGAVKE